MGTSPNGLFVPEAREIASSVFQSQAGGLVANTRAALNMLSSSVRYQGMEALVLSDMSRWVFVADSDIEDDTENLVLTPGDSPAEGRWLRADDAFVMKIPFSFANTDDEVIFTVPAGFAFRLTAYPFLDIATSFTGGTSSSFGISTNITGYTADGALVGVSLAAAATAGVRPGTIGAELPDLAHFQALLFVEDSAIEYNRVVDAFTAGAADLCLPVALVRV